MTDWPATHHSRDDNFRRGASNANVLHILVAAMTLVVGHVSAVSGQMPVHGDWSGDGRTKVGTFFAGTWLLDQNGNAQFDFDGADRSIDLGTRGDTPVVGDWNHDGRTDVGVFRRGLWILDYNGNGRWDGTTLDRTVDLGTSGDTPVVGDWNGDGQTDVGVFRQGLWVLDYNGNGRWDGTTIDRAIGLGTAGVVRCAPKSTVTDPVDVCENDHVGSAHPMSSTEHANQPAPPIRRLRPVFSVIVIGRRSPIATSVPAINCD